MAVAPLIVVSLRAKTVEASESIEGNRRLTPRTIYGRGLCKIKESYHYLLDHLMISSMFACVVRQGRNLWLKWRLDP